MEALSHTPADSSLSGGCPAFDEGADPRLSMARQLFEELLIVSALCCGALRLFTQSDGHDQDRSSSGDGLSEFAAFSGWTGVLISREKDFQKSGR
jgi:hypothetical protein